MQALVLDALGAPLKLKEVAKPSIGPERASAEAALAHGSAGAP